MTARRVLLCALLAAAWLGGFALLERGVEW
jgi:hypothetical protein